MDKKVDSWKIFTKWWYFPALYLFLAFILVVIKSYPIYSYPLMLYFLPNGLILLIVSFFSFLGLEQIVYPLIEDSGPEIPSTTFLIFPILFFIYAIISIIKINLAKVKENRTLKKTIVILLVLLLLSFFGCSLTKGF